MGFDWHKESATQWNRMSDNWKQNSKEMWEEGSRKEVIPTFTQHLSPEKGPVLDAGCGDGYGTWTMAKLGFEMVGIDISGEMIQKAGQRQDQGLKMQFRQADIVQLPFADEAFAGILSINVLEWVESPLAALQELKRILKPGGLLCLGILGPTAAPRQHSYKRLYGQEVICNTMMPWECGRLVEENGFAIIDQRGVYKRGVQEDKLSSLSLELKQALTFLWIFVLQKK